jgi:phosphotransferase system enzyme I (PtsP)
MLIDLDLRKAATLVEQLIECPTGSVSIRDKLTAFAEAEGLQL